MRTIPARFNILGHEITVKWRDDLLSEHEAWGLCEFHEHTIYMQRPPKGLNVSKSHLLGVFWHEYFHMALYCLGHTELCMDEELVDQLGNAVHQFMKTKLNT